MKDVDIISSVFGIPRERAEEMVSSFECSKEMFIKFNEVMMLSDDYKTRIAIVSTMLRIANRFLSRENIQFAYLLFSDKAAENERIQKSKEAKKFMEDDA